ncbi:GntR family transcriptional regulator [Streptomyces armeniacus]|uniref:GntR family transcriptional regulator n=1 Tax=Streptomyces armeniacus TaxID=83291 RepID=A0A345XTL7_9ACTN|nr:GntR family transcriptional regulator [Streptomyces armeniacus]AXK34983.1 GntR family transcriptional regulator [Streptomyces armeniacus]
MNGAPTGTGTTRPGGRPVTPLPRRQMLADDVHEAIKELIMDNSIAPGERVSIDGLARQLGVSPTPVREALARLESAELVVKEPHRGYRTTALLNRDELEDLYRFRLLIEPWAAARAAERTDDAGRERLRTEMTSVDAPRDDHYDAYKALAAHDTRFHVLVAELAGSEQVRLAFERTHCHLHIFRLYYDRGVGQKTLEEHRLITDAVLSGDPEAADAAMRNHLEKALYERLRPVSDAPGVRPGP